MFELRLSHNYGFILLFAQRFVLENCVLVLRLKASIVTFDFYSRHFLFKSLSK